MTRPSSFKPLKRVDAPDGSRRPYLEDPETGEGHYVTNVVTDANDGITDEDFNFAPPRSKKVEAAADDDYEPTDEDWADLAAADPDEVWAAAGKDITPGRERLHHYWVRGRGLARWKTWTELVAQLTEKVGLLKAKTYASRWFYERYGFYAGSDKNRVMHGKPPRGKVVGPG